MCIVGNAMFRLVLSSAKIGVGSWRYYQREVATSPSEYFLAGGEAPGRWWGQGLGEVGLAPGGVVSEPQLEALFARALHPVTGQRLGRGWRADGVTGFDLTFSAPKSVSALWAIGGPEIARQVAAAHAAAVRAGLDYLEQHAGVSRRGRDGVEQVDCAGFAAAVFDHRTSRAGDPQLHSHALVVNKVRCGDGVWRTIDGHEVYHHKKSAGMVYQAALRAELTDRLGVAFDEPNRHGQAEVAGVPADLVQVWSKRAAAVDADAAGVIGRFEDDLGRPLTPGERARVVKTSVLATRPAKTHADPGVLQQRWVAEAGRLGWTADRLLVSVAKTAATGPQQPTALDRGGRMSAVERALSPLGHSRVSREALAAAGRRRSTFSRADVAGEVAAHLPVRAGSARRVLAQVEQLTGDALGGAEAVPVGTVRDGVLARASDARWTTAAQLAVEIRILRTAVAGRTAGVAVVPEDTAAACAEAAGLGADQHAALRRLTGDGQQVAVLIAPAGAGKTRTIGAAAAAWCAAGYDVAGLAPSARVAAELSAATGTRADTVAKWLHDRTRDGGGVDRHPVGPRTVLVVDEASMLATADLAALVDAADGAGAKLVLVGDPAQIGPVERAGGLLVDLADRVDAAQLTDVRRFTHGWEAQATRLLRRGEPTVLDVYAAQHRIHPAADADTALDAVHTRWRDAVRGGQDALMMARARVDVDALNHRARTVAIADGAVTGPVLARAAGRDWQVGDLLRARRNDRRLPVGDTHVRNGDRFRVLAATPDGGLVVDDLTGRGRTELPAGYLHRHATYGWASTIDGAQGATTDIGILLARPGLDREHLYVAMTRGRHANHVHVTGTSDEQTEHRRVASHGAAVTSLDQATQTLKAAAVRVGAQQSAHSLLEQSRNASPARPVATRPPTPSPAVLRTQAELTQASRRAYRTPPPSGQRLPSRSM